MPGVRRPELARASARFAPRRRCAHASVWAVGLALVVASLSATPCARAEVRIDSLRVIQSADAWTLEVPFTGRWTETTATDPARIVLDLMGSRSRLPRAPDLYALELPRGPVEVLRTSQVVEDPGQGVVRVTLMLHETVAYHVERAGGALRLRMERPAGSRWGKAYTQTIRGGAAPLAREPLADPRGNERRPANAGSDSTRDLRPEGNESPTHAAPTPAPGGGDQADGGLDGVRQTLDDRFTMTPVRPHGEAPASAEAQTTKAAVAAATNGTASDEALAQEKLEALLEDSSLVESRISPSDAREIAAARTVTEAQREFLEGDTTAAIDALLRCEQFYGGSDAARQGSLLRRLMLRFAGRLVEAELGPAPSIEGPWPLFGEEVLAFLFEGAFAREDYALADEVLSAWQTADTEGTGWVPSALRFAESCFDRDQAKDALRWARLAREARPDLSRSPKTLLLLASAHAELGECDAADALLSEAVAADDAAVRARASALRADLRFRQKRYSEAQVLYEQLLGEGVPRVERDWARYQIGNCMLALGDPRGAATWLSEVAGDAANLWAPSARLRVLDLQEIRSDALR